MKNNLEPSAPLSQVVFVHDYLQLVFQDEAFTIYNDAELHLGSACYRTGRPGFRDALVAAIGERITSASSLSGGMLELVFEGGLHFAVRTTSGSVYGPEAWQFSSPGKSPVVQQNV